MRPPGVAKAVFQGGVFLGSPDPVAESRESFLTGADDRTVRERLDDAVRRIDDHLA
jgi:hypothetical protein